MDAAATRFDASRWVGRTTRTRIRAVRVQAPAFADAPITCGGVPAGEGQAKLWVRGADGHEHVVGEVDFD